MRFIDRDEVRTRLTYAACIPIVRAAMIAFSAGETRQHLRSFLALAQGRLLGIMPGALGETAPFGAKLISIYPDNFAQGRQSHQGVVVLFEPSTGAPVCIVDAGEITAIRTAAASAAATAALARPDAHVLGILGYGEQAATHARAIPKVRDIRAIRVWGRSPERREAFCAAMSAELELPVTGAQTVPDLCAQADIICTLTAAREPLVRGAWVRPGTHLNLVGSSVAGPVEVDNDLVARARFIVDSRAGVLHQGAEFLAAKAAGLIGDEHIVGEIGHVFAGEIAARTSTSDITVYKSIGHIVQDLACAWALYAENGPLTIPVSDDHPAQQPPR
jgi:ornithine cyclodeaminase